MTPLDYIAAGWAAGCLTCAAVVRFAIHRLRSPKRRPGYITQREEWPPW